MIQFNCEKNGFFVEKVVLSGFNFKKISCKNHITLKHRPINLFSGKLQCRTLATTSH